MTPAAPVRTATHATTRTAPAFGTVLGLLLLPLVLISFNTVLDTLITAGVIEEGAGLGRGAACCSATPRSPC